MLQQAMQFHQAGQLTEAETAYRQALAENPNLAQANNNLGTILQSRGALDEAAACFQRAVALAPERAEYHFNLAGLCRDRGRLDLAIAHFMQAAQLRPDFAEALANAGAVLGLAGRFEEAIAFMQRAAVVRPDLPDNHSNLGNAYCQTRQWDLAIASISRALALQPDFPQAHNNLGNVHSGMGHFDRAAGCYRRAIELQPHFAEFHVNLAVTLRGARKYDESIAACRSAMALQPTYAEAWCNLGSALACKGEMTAAESAYRQALALRADYLEPYTNLGHLHFARGQWDQAAAIYREVIARRGDDPQAHWSLGFILLLRGDYAHGWVEYEWRWRVAELRLRPRLKSPQWDGAELGGRTLLVHYEQGYGDTIQFVRYLPQIVARGGRVIVSCPAALVSLIQNADGIDHCVDGDLPPPHDLACPLLSLPRLFGTTVATIPAKVPYLRAEPAKVEYWRRRLADGRGLKIGLAWAGRATHPNDRNRSLVLSALAPVMEVGGSRFISLQKGEAADQARGTDLADWTDELKDFGDTAGLVANLDVVITVDSAVAHLAGAMGKPVWVLLPFVPDWRWMLDRDDSPWYPTMRLFRQPSVGDWRPVVRNIAAALKEIDVRR